MFALSGAILNDCAPVLNDGRGVLISRREISNPGNDGIGRFELPMPPCTHTLEFDGSSSQAQFGWRYTVVDPAKGRTVRTMIVSANAWNVQETVYDQQGVLRDDGKCADPSGLSAQIGLMVADETFKQSALDLIEKRKQAEADLAKLALDLTNRNLGEEKVAKLTQKPRMGVLARSFVSCSPIV